MDFHFSVTFLVQNWSGPLTSHQFIIYKHSEHSGNKWKAILQTIYKYLETDRSDC